MKELNFSFEVNITPKRNDVHVIETELLKIRQEIFIENLVRALKKIEKEISQERKRCSRCGGS